MSSNPIHGVCQWIATGQWFSLGSPVSSTNKTDHHDIGEILLKVALNTINQKPKKNCKKVCITQTTTVQFLYFVEAKHH